jgi:chemotaxis protein methyltransferase CheR
MQMNQEVVEFVRNLIRERAGIDLDCSKDYLVFSRLEPVARAEGFDSIDEMIDILRRRPSSHLSTSIVDAMLTKETSFFRDTRPFDVLRDHIIPEVMQSRRKERTLSIWSAACASGQEPYSIAMLIKEHFPELLSWRLRILASDLSQAMISRSCAGRYSQLEVNRGLPARMLIKYFNENGMDWQISTEIRNMIEWRQINLCEPWINIPSMDIVFLRNVLIYLHMSAKKEILGRLRKVLRSDGYLFMGTAETTLNLDRSLQPVYLNQSVCYRLGELDEE